MATAAKRTPVVIMTKAVGNTPAAIMAATKKHTARSGIITGRAVFLRSNRLLFHKFVDDLNNSLHIVICQV